MVEALRDMEAYYADSSKRLTLWDTTGKTLVAKRLPRLVAIPSIVAEWAAEMPRTLNKLVHMIECMIRAGQTTANCP